MDDGGAYARTDVQTNGCVWHGGCLRQIIKMSPPAKSKPIAKEKGKIIKKKK
jgi:hypothetical protein